MDLDIVKITNDLTLIVDSYKVNKIDKSMLEEFILKYGYILCEKYKAYGFIFVNLKDFTVNEIPIDYTSYECNKVSLSKLDISNNSYVKIPYMNNVSIQNYDFTDNLITSSDLSSDIMNACDLNIDLENRRRKVKEMFSSFNDQVLVNLVNSQYNIAFNDFGEIIFYVDYQSIYNNKDKVLKTPGQKDYIFNTPLIDFYKLTREDVARILDYPEFNTVYVKFIPSIHNLNAITYYSFDADMKYVLPNNIEIIKKIYTSKQTRFNSVIPIKKGKPLNIRIKSYLDSSLPFLGFYLLFGYRRRNKHG